MQLAQIEGSDLTSIQNSIGLNVNFGKISDVINEIVPYLFAFAGILLLLYLLYGGLTMMLSRGEPKAFEEAKAKITNSAIGFVIIFASYWIWQLAKQILGLS